MRALVAFIAVPLVIFAEGSVATAQDLVCDGVYNGVVADKVDVPPGANCALVNSDVGDVKVFGETLFAVSTRIRGDVKAKPGHGRVVLSALGGPGGVPTTVEGNVRIQGGQSSENTIIINSVVHGNLRARHNANGVLVASSSIGGDLEAFKNFGMFVGPTGPIPFSAVITNNTIGGDLTCRKNNPPPAAGLAANTVGGDKVDQCSAALGF